jgi:hypothetical protein
VRAAAVRAAAVRAPLLCISPLHQNQKQGSEARIRSKDQKRGSEARQDHFTGNVFRDYKQGFSGFKGSQG